MDKFNSVPNVMAHRSLIKAAAMKVTSIIRSITLLFWLCLLLSTSACTVVVQPAATPVAASGDFTLFLQPLPQEAHRLIFSVAELVALRVDGSEVPLPLQTKRFTADGLIGVQKRLTNVTLPPGRYQGIALRIIAADIQGEDGRVDLLPPKDRLVLEYPFTIIDKRAETLFLTLSADRLVTDGVFFTPNFSLWKPERLLSNLKGFVSNGRSQTLTVFNKRTAQVTDLIQIGKRPQGMVLDQQRGWLYVALAGEESITVVEVNNGEILGRVRLRFGDKPTELALTSSGKTLLSLNQESDSISIIDTMSLFERGRIRLLAKPSGIFLGGDETRAYVTHAAANALSVIDLPAQTVRSTVTLDDSPLDGVLSNDGRSIYLINDFSAELSVLDAASLVTENKVFIGRGATSVKADNSSGLLYIGKNNGEIAVVDSRALIAIDRYSLASESVQCLTIDNEENALFVVLPQTGNLLKIDLVSKKELGRLELGTGSHTVVVMGER